MCRHFVCYKIPHTVIDWLISSTFPLMQVATSPLFVEPCMSHPLYCWEIPCVTDKPVWYITSQCRCYQVLTEIRLEVQCISSRCHCPPVMKQILPEVHHISLQCQCPSVPADILLEVSLYQASLSSPPLFILALFFWDGYLNFSEWFVKYILLEQRQLNVWNEQHFAENKKKMCRVS